MNDKSSKAILITGASTGIGHASAVRMNALGYRVFAGVRREEDAQKLLGYGSDGLIPIFLDVTDQTAIKEAAENIREAVGDAGLHGLVNNAGIAVASPMEFVPVEDFREQMEINVTGQVAVTQAMIPLLRQACGRIVNISSFSGRVAAPFFGPYAASKFALEALSDSLRVELRPWGILVSIIEPGRIDTPIWVKSLAKAEERIQCLPSEARQLYGSVIERVKATSINSKRPMMTVERVADLVEHALTAKRPKARYIIGHKTGRTIVLLNIAPTWLRDLLIARRMGMKL